MGGGDWLLLHECGERTEWRSVKKYEVKFSRFKKAKVAKTGKTESALQT